MYRRQKLVFIAKMVLAELAGGVTQPLERGGNRYRLRGYADGCTGLPHRCHSGSDRQLASDEVGASRRTARLGVVVGENHAFGSDLIEVRRTPSHHAAMVSADVPHADIVAHDDDDIRLLGRLRGCRRGRHHHRGRRRHET